jgi:hypothetical protein
MIPKNRKLVGGELAAGLELQAKKKKHKNGSFSLIEQVILRAGAHANLLCIVSN